MVSLVLLALMDLLDLQDRVEHQDWLAQLEPQEVLVLQGHQVLQDRLDPKET